jgi:hypothetical protein
VLELTVATSYSEHLIVSDLAIVRVERRSEEELRRASAIVLVVGGIVGPLLAALAQRLGGPGVVGRLYLRHQATPALAEMNEVFTCWASDAPDELIAHPKWPRVESFRPVTFFPRASIESVVVSRLNRLRLTLKREASREVALPLPFWGRRPVEAHLVRAGYPVSV